MFHSALVNAVEALKYIHKKNQKTTLSAPSRPNMDWYALCTSSELVGARACVRTCDVRERVRAGILAARRARSTALAWFV